MSDAVNYFYRSPGAPLPVTVGASPFSYTNASAGIQLATLAGGGTTLIEINQGAGFVPAIGIAGVYTLMPSQTLRVTYLITPPTLTTIQL